MCPQVLVVVVRFRKSESKRAIVFVAWLWAMVIAGRGKNDHLSTILSANDSQPTKMFNKLRTKLVLSRLTA